MGYILVQFEFYHAGLHWHGQHHRHLHEYLHVHCVQSIGACKVRDGNTDTITYLAQTIKSSAIK